MIARSPLATWPYVLESDRKLPREQQTVFQLKHLSLGEEHALLDNTVRDPLTGHLLRQQVGSEHLNTLRKALVGWDRLPDDKNTPIPFEAGPWGGAKDELLFRIPLGAREELARAIENELRYDPDEVGKSSPASA